MARLEVGPSLGHPAMNSGFPSTSLRAGSPVSLCSRVRNDKDNLARIHLPGEGGQLCLSRSLTGGTMPAMPLPGVFAEVWVVVVRGTCPRVIYVGPHTVRKLVEPRDLAALPAKFARLATATRRSSSANFCENLSF